MPVRFVRLAFVRCKDGLVLFICGQRNCIPARRLQPLVKLVLIQEPSSARLGGWDGAILQLHVHGSPGDVRVLDGFLHSHGLVAVALMPITSSRSWATTCGRSLNVRISFSIVYHFFGESAAKELNDALLIPITHDNPRIIIST